MDAPALPEPPLVRALVQRPPGLASEIREERLGQARACLAVGAGPWGARLEPRATRWAIRRATAARQEWSALSTWPRNTHRVTSGEKIRSSQVPTAASAWARASSVRTEVNGRSPSWRNLRRRNRVCARNDPGRECRIWVASEPVNDGLPSPIFTPEAQRAYILFTVRLAEM